jgi:deoxycytidine triphosphate deaminase
MLLNDRQIGELCQGDSPMLEPFNPRQIRRLEDNTRALSHGLGSVGYDVTVLPEVMVLIPGAGVVDPKRHDPKQWQMLIVHRLGCERYVYLPPNAFALATTEVYFRMPSTVTALAIGKSTNARSGLEICSTMIEPGWEGQLVLEVKNQGPNEVKLYISEGAAQIIFLPNDEPDIHYGQRESNYQGQRGLKHGTA